MLRFIIPPMSVVCASLLFASDAGASPGPEPRGLDVLEGELNFQLDKCPVLIVSIRSESGEWSQVTYWLVFSSAAIEQQVCKSDPGSMVKATGKLGRGGQFRYLIVNGVVPK